MPSILWDPLAVGFVFNAVNRLANSLGFGWETEAGSWKPGRGNIRCRIARCSEPA